MFLVEDQRHGTTPQLVFSWEDPRKDGYKGNVIEDVHLDYNMEAVHSWPDGADRPEACVGRAGNDPKQYKVFKYRSELEKVGYQLAPGMPVVIGSWSRYVKLNPRPENLEKVPEEEWYERLDEYDEGARRRRRQAQEPGCAGRRRSRRGGRVGGEKTFHRGQQYPRDLVSAAQGAPGRSPPVGTERPPRRR